MSKKLISLFIAAVMIATALIPAFNAFSDNGYVVPNPVSDPSMFGKVDAEGWYTSPDGGFKFNVGEWKHYGKNGTQICEDPDNFPSNLAVINVYDPDSSAIDSPEDFENKTAGNFAALIDEPVTVFEKTTVGYGKYTMYYGQTESYENYVFQANGSKYYLNFVWVHKSDRAEFTAFVKQVMSTIIIANDEPERVVSVSHTLRNGEIIFTVETGAGNYNRVKAALSDNLTGYVGYSSSYTVNSAGNLVWTVKAPAPKENTRYAFDLRSGETNRYMKAYFYYDVETEQNLSPVKSVTHSFSGSKLVFKVVTEAGDFGRIKAALASTTSGSLGVGTEYTVNSDGDYVWTVKVPVPTETTKYVFDMRNTSGKYMKQYFEYEVSMDNLIKYAKYTEYQGRLMLTVVTKAGDFNRLRCGLSTGTKDNLANANKYTVDENGDFVWSIKIPRPVEDTTLFFDLRNGTTNKYYREFYLLDVEGIGGIFETVDHTNSQNWKKVVNSVFTSDLGGVQLYAPGWKTYGLYSISMLPETYNNQGVTNAICVAVYDKNSGSYDSFEDFENKTKEEFKGILQSDIDTFEKTKITCDGKEYTCYKAYVTDVYYVWVFQTENAKYFINFMQAQGKSSMKTVAETMMSTIRIFEAPQQEPAPRPDHSDSNNWKKVVNSVFTSDKGGIQLDALGWKTYGLYGISMVPETYNNSGQCNAICVAVYDKNGENYDSYEAFENKTKADFENILQQNVDSLVKTKITYNGKNYTCYKAVVTGVYYVWLFQTENAKYFINFMQVPGLEDMQAVGETMMSTIRIFEEPQAAPSETGNTNGVINKTRTEQVSLYNVDYSTFEPGDLETRTITYKGTIKVGNTAATGGVYASVGVPYNAGIEAYFNAVNFYGGMGGNYETGEKGYYIEFIHYNDDFDSAKGLYYTEKLVEEDGVFALVGHFGSPTVYSTIDYIKEKGVIACYLASGIEDLYNENADSVAHGSTIFPVQPIYATEGRVIVGRIIDQYPTAKKIGIIYTTDECGTGIKNGAVAQIEAVGNGYTAVTYETSADSSNFTSAVNAVSDCDVVIAASIQKGVTGILKSMISNKVLKPVFTSYSVATASTLTEIKSEYDKLQPWQKFPIYTNFWLSSTDVESYLYFCADCISFTGDYEYVSSSYAMAGWIAADVFCNGLYRTFASGKEITTVNFVEAMESEGIFLAMANSSAGPSYLDYSDGYRVGTTKMGLLKNNETCNAFEECADMKDFLVFIKSGNISDING